MKKVLALVSSLLLVATFATPAQSAGAKYSVYQRTLATFSSSATTLTSQQKAQVRASVDANPYAEKFICTGIRYYDQPMSVNITVRKRAKAACEYAKQLNPALSTWYQNKPTRARSYAGKVLLTIKTLTNVVEEQIELNAPVLTSGFPSVIGDPSVGGSLRVADSTWGGTVNPIAHNWFSCDANYGNLDGGATVPPGCSQIDTGKSSISVTSGLIGAFILVQTVASNAEGTTVVVAILSQPIEESPKPPSLQYSGGIIGELRIGSVLFADRGSWSGATGITASTSWFSCPSPTYNTGIGGQVPDNCTLRKLSSDTYQVEESDRGRHIVAKTQASNSVGTATLVRQTTYKVPEAGDPPALKAPGQLGDVRHVGSTVSLTPATWNDSTPSTYSYEWFVCDQRIASTGLNASLPGNCRSTGVTTLAYSLKSQDEGKFLAVLERASNTHGVSNYVYSNSLQILPPMPKYVDGAAIQGNLLQNSPLSIQAGNWLGAAPITFSAEVYTCPRKQLTRSFDQSCTFRVRLGSSLQPFTLSSSDVDRYVVALVYARNSVGASAHVLNSEAKLAAPANAPSNLSLPSVASPTSTVGEVVTYVPGKWSGAARVESQFRVCIFEDCGDSGIFYDGVTLTLNSDMIGKYVRVRETAYSPGETLAKIVESGSIGPIREVSPASIVVSVGLPFQTHIITPGTTVTLPVSFSGNPAPEVTSTLLNCDSVPTFRENDFNEGEHGCIPLVAEQVSTNYWQYTSSGDEPKRYLVWSSVARNNIGVSRDADWAALLPSPVEFSVSQSHTNIGWWGSFVELTNISGLTEVQAHVCRDGAYKAPHLRFAKAQLDNCKTIDSFGPKHAVFFTSELRDYGYGYVTYTGLLNGVKIWSPFSSPTAGGTISDDSPLIQGYTASVGTELFGLDSPDVPSGLEYQFEWYSCSNPKTRGGLFDSSTCTYLGFGSSFTPTGSEVGTYITGARAVREVGSTSVLVRLASNSLLVSE